MRETFHIFKKDARRLWREILVVLVLGALFAWIEPRTAPSWSIETRLLNSVAAMLRPLLVVAWWYLIVAVIHQEALPGNRQYWLTRPIGWNRLLGAKLLFVFVFVNLPVFLADCVILAAAGFRPWEHLPGLLMRQALFTALFLTPAAILAAVTQGLAQLILWVFVTGAFSIAVASVLSGHFVAYWSGLAWIKVLILAVTLLAGAVAVLLIQYRRRGTAFSRAWVAGLVVCALSVMLFAPWGIAFAVQSRLSRQPVDAGAARVSFDREAKPSVAPSRWSPPYTVTVDLALRVADIPDGMDAVCDRFTATIDGPGGVSWQPDWARQNFAFLRNQSSWATIHVDRSFFERMKHQPVKLRGSLYLTLFGNLKTARIPAQTVWSAIPGVGFCGTDTASDPRMMTVSCRHALQSPARMWINLVDRETGAKDAGRPRTASYSPFPATEPNISPVETSVVAQYRAGASSADSPYLGAFDPRRLPQTDIVFETLEPVAHIRRDFEIRDLRLADHAVIKP